MEVTSDSIIDENLKTVCAADRSPNRPLGKNESPELSWEDVDGAEYYAAIMIDESASDWVHMFATGPWTTELSEGQLSSSEYIGPYPPAGTGQHDYTMVVFALSEDPSGIDVTLDSPCDYDDLTGELESYGVLDSGSVTGLFGHGDETV